MTRSALITGFPKAELACWVLRAWLENDADATAVCVVPARFRREADARLKTLGPTLAQRVRLLEGDAGHMDLGLSGPVLREVTRELNVIHHCAAMVYSGVEPRRAHRFNTQAAREIVEVALYAPKLERLVHWSSTRAVGSMHGVIREDVMEPPRRGHIAESRFQAERIVREGAARLPLTVLRTASLVGDSKTGRWPRVEGAYLIARTLLGSSPDVSLPMPARRDGVLNVVPVDFAAEAGCAIAEHPSSVGRTFHIVDPEPPTVAEAFRMFAHLTGRPEPRQGLPGPVAEAILNTPGISRLAHGQRDLLDDLGRRALYDAHNARQILEPLDLHCPPLAEYAPRIVSFMREAPGSGERLEQSHA